MKTVWTDSEIKGKILHKLTRLGKFHHSHTSIDNLHKGFPKEIGKDIRRCVDGLLKEGILFAKPTSYGLEVSINTEKKEKIMEYIDVFFEKE